MRTKTSSCATAKNSEPSEKRTGKASTYSRNKENRRIKESNIKPSLCRKREMNGNETEMCARVSVNCMCHGIALMPYK